MSFSFVILYLEFNQILKPRSQLKSALCIKSQSCSTVLKVALAKFTTSCAAGLVFEFGDSEL
jgi:hypothetical protein